MRRSIVLKLSFAVIAIAALVAAADGSAFTAGNLVISEVGDGTAILANTGNPLSLVEYTTAGSLVQTIGIPSTGSTGLEPSGSASSEGALCLSADGHCLAFAGYNNVPIGNLTPLAASPATGAGSFARGYSSVDYSGTYAFGGTFGSYYGGNNIRGAATDNGTNFWGVGANSDGTILEPGNTTIQNLVPNCHNAYIHDGDLYLSSGKNGTVGIWAFSGLPMFVQGATSLITGVTGQGNNPFGFAISPGPIAAGSYAYLADGAKATGVQKFTFDGTNWSLAYNLPANDDLTGLAVDFTTDTLFTVSPTKLYETVDAGSSSAWSTLVTLTDATHYAFRGLSFAPTAPPPPQHPGDANGDNKVDINDLTIVLTNYGQPGMDWSHGDFNHDNKVDINDLTIVLSNYNTTYSASAAAVPEPSSIALLAGAGCLVVFACRRRAQVLA